MTQDDIIRMARHAKIECDLIDDDEGQIWYITTDTLARFAAIVSDRMIRNGYRKCAQGQRTTQFCGQLEAAVAGAVAAEREACALVAEDWDSDSADPRDIAAAIRERSTND